MRRQDFIDNITNWDELISFCYDEDCDICEDICSEDEKDERINADLTAWARNYTWYELYDILDAIPTGAGYYYEDDWGDWQEVDDNLFDERKDKVLEWMDHNDRWDEEEEEYDELFDIIVEEEDLAPVESDVPLDDLFLTCNNGLKSIQSMQQKEAETNDEIFDSFIMNFTATEAERR